MTAQTSEVPPSPQTGENGERWAALERTLRWMLQLRDGQGRILCPEHKVEHSGKNAGVIVMALELAKRKSGTQRAELIEVAWQQGDRLVACLEREGTSPCFTFRPGRHDPFNCSNSVIDGGAAADALGALVRETRTSCTAERLQAYEHACLTHARTYLRYAILDKGVPAQRAWGMTGLGSAYTLEQDPILHEAAQQATVLLRDIQQADGSYPYHPMSWGAGHPGASDVSAYYQSRVTAFVLHAALDLGLDLQSEELSGPMRRGLEFLLTLQGPDGRKCGLLEAKPWYWGATYEVASHPFDMAALAYGWKVYGDARYRVAALRAMDAWADHVDAQGMPHSHHPAHGTTRSYQCPVFWAGHAMWIARALTILDSHPSEDSAGDDSGTEQGTSPQLIACEDASLYRLEDAHVVAWVRGSRPPGNVAHGSPQGAGLIRVLRKSDGRELLPRCRLGGHQSGEWCGKSGPIRPGRGWRAGAKEVRFSLWIARVHWRAGRCALALKTPLATFRRGVLAFAHPRVSSAFHLSPEVSSGPGALLRMKSALAWRDGSPVSGTQVLREFEVDGGGLLVRETMLSSPGVRALDYRVPKQASEVQRDGDEIRYRLR